MNTKTITEDDRLKALGLWTLCTSHYGEARTAEAALRRMLGDDVVDSGISDSIYASDGPWCASDFDDALKGAGVEVVGIEPMKINDADLTLADGIVLAAKRQGALSYNLDIDFLIALLTEIRTARGLPRKT